MSKITVIGAGYVGLTTAVGLAELGHTVTCLEIDAKKVAMLMDGKSPIFEQDLEDLLNRNLSNGRLSFTNTVSTAMNLTQFIYVCVQTPQDSSGAANMTMVDAAIASAKPFASQEAIWVTKSTVPVGTARRISSSILEGSPRIVSNPEFLREGTALRDFFNPDRILIGSASPEIGRALATVYQGLNAPVVQTNWETAELLKYAANSFLATKLSFINEMAILCQSLGGDIDDLRLGLGLDERISPSFLQNGPGWGGSCFPKDVSALNHTVEELGLSLPLIQSILPSNSVAKASVVKRVNELATNGARLGVWGLTFKADTDDLRDSPSVEICKKLASLGFELTAYDPTVRSSLEACPEVVIADSLEQSLQGVEGLIVLTEWSEFTTVHRGTLARANNLKWVLDTRNVLNPALWIENGILFAKS